jgi:tight adherence protein C
VLADLTLPLVLVGVFIATSVITLALTAPFERPGARLVRHIRYAGPVDDQGDRSIALSLRERVAGPLSVRFVEVVTRRTSTSSIRAVAAELTMAGSQLSPATFLAMRAAFALVLPVLVVFYILASGSPTLIGWILLGLSLIWGRRLPGLLLRRRMRARQREIDRRLPYAVDLIVACLEGGLSLDAALLKVVEQSHGPLTYEIQRTLHEMTLGRPSSEAIRDLGERTGAPGLKRLTENIAEADRLGVSITDSLRGLAGEMRVQRRQQAEEAARKAPIKMVPVLIFCVLPALGIVTVFPAGILLMRTLSNTVR